MDKGAEVDRATKDGATPLYVALEEGTEVVQLLLDNVTDVSCSLAFAEKKDDSAIIDLLEGHLDKPLHVAAKAGNLDEIKRLLEGDVRLCDSRTALRVASMAGDTDTINLLLKRGAKVNRAARDGKTALHAACQNGQIDAVRLLLGKGAKVDRVDKEKTTPLHVACELGHAEVARLLLEKGAKPDKKNGKGLTPAAIAKSNQAVSGVLRRYAK
uniref:Uncharacterized protein n=1 Tax=Pelagomonas calceolata TaxID=35677 RepID=A0A7S4EBH4_9STRA